MLRSMRPLIQRGFKVTIKYAIPCLHHVRESPKFVSVHSFEVSQIQARNWQTSNAFVKFPICFHSSSSPFFFFFFLFSASKNDDSLMFKGRLCLYRFIVIAQSLDEFPLFLFLGSNSSNIWDPYYSHAHGLLLLATLL